MHTALTLIVEMCGSEDCVLLVCYLMYRQLLLIQFNFSIIGDIWALN